jgi:hypothetical protein
VPRAELHVADLQPIARRLHLTGMKAQDTVSTFRYGPLWIAALAALLLGALAVGVLIVSSSNRAQAPVAAAKQSPAPSEAPASPAPSEELAAAPVANVTPFRCTASTLTAQNPPAVATINAVRTGAHSGYDRLVVQFSGKQPGSIDITPQATASFLGAPSGAATNLAGTRGLKLVIKGSDMHTAYSGSRDIKTGYVGLRETGVIEDFEGYVSLGLGINGSNCYRAFVLSNPNRLVVDIQTS